MPGCICTTSNLNPSPGDSQNALLSKILQRLNGFVHSGDSDYDLLRRILTLLGDVSPSSTFVYSVNGMIGDVNLGTLVNSVDGMTGNVSLVGRYVRIAGDTMTGDLTLPRLISTVPTGTAPFTVASTTVFTNLNADLLEDRKSTRLNSSH